MLVVTHDMDFVGEACPTTIVLSHGTVRFAGTTSDAFQDRLTVEEAGIEEPHVTALARAIGLGPVVSERAFLAAWKPA